VKSGDYTGLANDYSRHRPDYCPSVLDALLGLLPKPVADVDFTDVGAGTGIWTRMVYNKGVRLVTAIEPNDDMRAAGMADSANTTIRWLAGQAEKTGAPDSSNDWVTMASSFHWTDFDAATREFHRVLRPQGRFTALWNSRLVDVNPLLAEIERHLRAIQPSIKRASSEMKGTLTEQLWSSPWFEDVVYIEGRHTINMSPERYLGIWRSVNELRLQLGEKNFDAFLDFVRERIAGQRSIDATYLTRAWSARRKDCKR
jgi:ubiquinone/menaquinone biosynthesis C-methylase UbiE